MFLILLKSHLYFIFLIIFIVGVFFKLLNAD